MSCSVNSLKSFFCICAVGLGLICLEGADATACQQTESLPLQSATPDESLASQPSVTELRSVIADAFEKTHDGWSSDEMVLHPELNEKFIAECQSRLPAVSAVEFNWTLLNMRKAGLLKVKTTRRNSQSVDQYVPIAEVAARHVFDRYKVSTDRLMADPEMRTMFDQAVHDIDPAADLYLVRKAAFKLRKQRQLRPELIARIVDWGRTIATWPLADVRSKPESIPALPGIYIFRDQTGYLYIGQSDDLQQRLKEHLDASSNFSLAKYLADQSNDNVSIEIHSFAADSRAKETMIRRAYESELIASRKPRFNIQP